MVVDSSIDAARTKFFFLGYRSSHYMYKFSNLSFQHSFTFNSSKNISILTMNFYRGGHQNSIDRCDGERYVVLNKPFPGECLKVMIAFESVIGKMRTPVNFLNITVKINPRKDGHPSVYIKPKEMRKRRDVQDCINWCFPGVLDARNRLLYTMLYMDAKSSMDEYLGMEK